MHWLFLQPHTAGSYLDDCSLGQFPLLDMNSFANLQAEILKYKILKVSQLQNTCWQSDWFMPTKPCSQHGINVMVHSFKVWDIVSERMPSLSSKYWAPSFLRVAFLKGSHVTARKNGDNQQIGPPIFDLSIYSLITLFVYRVFSLLII